MAPDLLTEIENFLAGCRRPAAVETGENPIPLLPGQYCLQMQSGRLCIEIWDETRSLARRIVAVERRSTAILDCTIQRFGGKPGRLSFLDMERPQTAHRSLTAARQNFAEQFRQMITRQFPGWQLDALTVSQDLRRSFSSVYPRARLTRGSQILAVMACQTPEQEPHLLSFALIWHCHAQNSAAAGQRVSLALFLPEGSGNITAHRLHWLDAEQLHQPAMYLFNQHGSAGQVDPDDLGNLETRVTSQPAAGGIPAVGWPPERWLESVVRANITSIHSQLVPEPVHNQVLTFAACDRDLIDLLAISLEGRLCVLELKASEDLHLPIQALDYWMRVAWHARRAELTHLFHKSAISPQPPRLLLVAPAMAFHSTNSTILGYFSPEIEVERIGVNSDWRNELKVILRLRGAAVPASHV